MGASSSVPSMEMADSMHNVLSKFEFAVKMSCDACAHQIRKQFDGLPGVSRVDINVGKGSVVVETSLPSAEIQQKIEASGKEAVLLGAGGTEKNKNLGAAVAMLGGESGFSEVGVHGVVRFIQLDEASCLIDGTLDGLTPGKHGLHVHECGDISQGCKSVGDHFNPLNAPHGSPQDDEENRHAGDLGNIVAGQEGRAVFRIADRILKVWDVIGRSVVVTEAEDDLGRGNDARSKVDGNSGERLACGIIARSAGLFENTKKICACDGVTLWDEKKKPLTGPGRRHPSTNGSL